MAMKIRELRELADIIKDIRSKNKNRRIVHCHGVFDLLHIGHIRYFEQAKRLGDLLVVTITPDRFVDKGPHRPAFTENLRAEAIASLSCVDFVAINHWPTAEDTLRLIRPDFYVKGSEFKDTGSDMTGKIGREEKVVKEIGATLAFTEDIVFSSSNLINRYLSHLPKEIQEYLKLFKTRYPLKSVIDVLEKMASLNVLVLGDAIIDEYQYCEAIGKSSKDPVLAIKYQSHDVFAGGVLAVANHIANFAKKVKLVTILGECDSYEDFIRNKLSPKITPYFIIKPNASTIIKRRFIDGYSFNKLLEVYVLDDTGLPPKKDHEVSKWLQQELPQYDLVIAADFGHGAISKQIRNTLERHAKFLAVNTQANAGNRGFHTITRYPRADYACLAEHEIRLELRDPVGPIRPMMDTVAKKIGCRRMVVTRGRRGCLVRDEAGDFIEVPAYAQKIVDRVGAGDAFFSVTAMAAVQDAPHEVLGFIGNVVGALAVEFLGNQKPIEMLAVKKYLVSLLK